VPITLEQSEGLNEIRLEGAIDIASAAELKALLLQALASGSEVRVLLQDATELDVTAVQLLWAAGREARNAGSVFTLVEPLPEEITKALAEAGLEVFCS
jgi:anti-anti-sigma factor